MGFADDVAKRISSAFRRDKDQANIQLAKGATGDRDGGDSSAIDLMSGVGYDALTDYLRLDTDLLLRFADYEEMDDYGEIACLTGNSEVGVLGDGPYGVNYVTVADLIATRAADPAKKFFTLAVDLEGRRVVPVEMRGPVLSGKQSPVFKVTFEEYRSQPNEPKKQWSVRATANHPFMLRDGTYRTVAQLTPGTRLMAAGFAKTAGGYAQVRDLFNTRAGKSQYDYLHRMVCREILNEGNAIGNDDVVHHLDENKLNNEPSNLQVVRRADHAREHAPTQTPAVRTKLSKIAKARWSAAQRRTKVEDLAVNHTTNPTPKGVLSEAHRQAIAAGRTLPLAKDIVENALRTSTSISAAARSLKVSDSTLMRRVLHYGLSTRLIGTSLQSIHLGEEAYSNHVVVSVEPDGFDDVFDIEVPKYRNFLVAGGVFVHNTALDILADDATQPDSVLHRTIWITSADKTLQTNLDDLFNRTLRMDEEIWEIARTLCKYGNDYEELLVNSDGVRGLNYLPPPTVRRLETPKGDLIGFMQDFKGRFDFTSNDFQRTLSAKFDLAANTDPLNPPVAAFESWEVVHFRLRGKERRSVYGHSALEAARWIWKRLMLLEDAALVYRLQRAPERFAFYVDVGDLPPQEALAFVNRVRQNFRKKRFVDPGTGKLNLKFDALPVAYDTPIPLLDGRTITIEEMNREHAAGIKHFVYSIDRDTGKPVPGEVTWVGQTREKAAALKIVFDDGGSATVAPDHPFMLRDRSYVNAEALKPGDSVMPFYRNLGTGRLDGYEHWYDPSTHKYYPTHRIVSDAVNGPLPKGDVVHHVNFKKRDNTPTNLQTILWGDHMALHKSAGHTGGVAVSGMRKEDPALDQRLRAASTRNITAYNRSPTKRAATSSSNTLRDSGQFIRRYNNSPKHNEDNEIRRAGKTAMWADAQRKESASANMRLKFPPEFVSVVQGAIRSNPELRAGAAVAAANTPAALTALRAANTRHVDKVHRHMLLKLYRSEGADSFADYKNQVLHPTNHKVVSVTPVDPCDHYCMTVKDWHNFALNLRDDKGEVIFGSGVFVKNSQDEDFFVPTRKGVDSTRIETLGAPQWQAMDDIEYFRDKLFSAIKVPKAYLGQESGVARAVLSSEDVRFARTVLRIQRELKNGLRKVARVHLAALKIDPYAAEYDINMTVPSAIFELAQMEVRTAKADLAARMRDFVSLQWILSNVFGLSEDEIAVIKKERSGESEDDAKNQAAAQDILVPPPPPMEAPPGEEGPYGPPTEDRQPNRILKALNSSRDAARRRGIPTRNGISDRELHEGRNPAAEKRADAKLDAILKADRGLELRLREIGGLLRDLNHRGSR